MPSNFKGLNEGMGHLGAGILGVKKGSEQGAMIENMLQAERSDCQFWNRCGCHGNR